MFIRSLHLSIGILQLWIISSVAQKDCRMLKPTPAIEGKTLQGHVLRNLTVKQESGCITHCFAEENCMSYNVGPKLVDDTHNCELSNSDHVIHPEDLVDRAGFVYQPFENACQSRPCPPSSVCQNGFTDKDYRCVQGLLPSVTIKPQTEVTETGREVKFMCHTTGKFDPKVKWSKLDGSLPESRSVVREGNLTILNVTTDDSGSYVCTATNIMGNKSVSVKLKVYTALKFITRPPSSVTLYTGQTLKLPCSASSDLQPTVSWMFNGNPSLPQGASIDVSNNLIILSVDLTHAGIYTCKAKNSLSSLQANVTVYVYPETCSTVKANISDVSGDYVIDPDGAQGEAPFTVYCDMIGQGGIGVTVVSHDSEKRTHVNGFESAGSYSRDIHYISSSLSQIRGLIKVSAFCQQFIKYECKGSVITYEDGVKYAWWVSRDGQSMTYWGVAPQDCECRITNSCADPSKLCNCDANDPIWREDSGLLTNKTHLPVSQLRFGDTGNDGEEGYHTLGKLECYGMN